MMKYFLATVISILMLSTSWNLYAGAKGGGKKPRPSPHQKISTPKQAKKVLNADKKETQAKANVEQKYKKYMEKLAQPNITVEEKIKYRAKMSDLLKNNPKEAEHQLREMKAKLPSLNTNTTSIPPNITQPFSSIPISVIPIQAKIGSRNATTSQTASTSSASVTQPSQGLGSLGAQAAAKAAPPRQNHTPNRVNASAPRGVSSNNYSSSGSARNVKKTSYDSEKLPLQ